MTPDRKPEPAQPASECADEMPKVYPSACRLCQAKDSKLQGCERVIADLRARVAELERELEEAVEWVRNMPELIEQNFYVRHDHRYSGVQISNWLDEAAAAFVVRLKDSGTNPGESKEP